MNVTISSHWDHAKKASTGKEAYKGFLRNIPAPAPIIDVWLNQSFCSSHSLVKGR